MSKYTLEIKRFSRFGKYYDTIEFKTDAEFITLVSEEIKNARLSERLPPEFIYLITGDGHPDAAPALVL